MPTNIRTADSLREPAARQEATMAPDSERLNRIAQKALDYDYHSG